MQQIYQNRIDITESMKDRMKNIEETLEKNRKNITESMKDRMKKYRGNSQDDWKRHH
jgi:plasmid maintenance system antidote protein VapI